MDVKRPAFIVNKDISAYFLNKSEDENNVQRLYEQCEDYFLMLTGLPPQQTAAAELFEEFPPSKTIDDKVVLGLPTAKSDELIGLIEMIKNYPEEGSWFIGEFILKPDWRNKGTGEQLYKAYEAWALSFNVNAIGLGVVEQNTPALHFWERLGFKKVKSHPNRVFGNKTTTVIQMTKVLTC